MVFVKWSQTIRCHVLTLKRFRPLLSAEAGYYLTLLSSSIHFLKTFKISDDDQRPEPDPEPDSEPGKKSKAVVDPTSVSPLISFSTIHRSIRIESAR